MVKETRYQEHPVRYEVGLFLGSQQLDVEGINLMTLAAALTSGSLSTTGWVPLKLSPLVVAAAETIPLGAIAAILDVEVNDAGGAGTDTYLDLASPEHGVAGKLAGKTETVYCGDINDAIDSRLVIVEMSDDFSIVYKATASGGATLDYTLKLIGWIVGGTRIVKVTWPSVELYCKVVIGA
ncbi:hypothetical protein LCGC14_0497540 [marine sediment metagenome]|uniref:Uncharacterized protein n=1 Tax=marine sediment metagenome TaxID=412755 RepID=A0A0F9URU1_9ZZZZ